MYTSKNRNKEKVKSKWCNKKILIIVLIKNKTIWLS